MACLSDAFFLSLVDGELGEDDLTDADHHLDSCESCRDVVAELTLSRDGGGALSPGAEVGRYRIVDVLGRGAMGVVYSAFDPELDRNVALKLLHARLSQRSRDLLLGEARAMAKLSHSNVLPVFDASTSEGTAYIAMEQIDGRSLREWIGDENPDWQAIRDVFVAAGRGLRAAHEAGVVHRDFKPDNVLVGDDGAVKVGDFGLAVTDGGADHHGGTPAYMAPEQLAGGTADQRSDQFMFCASLYEALAGRRPFAGQARDVSPPPIGDIPRWLDRAIARGLARDPAERWPGLDALIDALQRRQRSVASVVAVAVVVAVVAAVAVVVAVGGSPLLVPSQGAQEAALPCRGARDDVAAVWNAARAEAIGAPVAQARSGFSRAAIATLVRALDDWRDGWVETHTAVCRATHVDGTQSDRLLDVRMHCLERGLRRVDAQIDQVSRAGHGVDIAIPAVIARLPDADACAALSLTLSEPPTSRQAEALPALERRLDTIEAAIAVGRAGPVVAEADDLVAEARSLGYAPFLAESLLARSAVHRALDQLPAAERDARDGLIAAGSASADRVAAAAWISIVSIATQRREFDQAARDLELARAAVSRVGAPRPLAAALAEVSGLVHHNRGDADLARTAFERALTLHGEPVEMARILAGLGNVERSDGNLDQALAHHRRAGELDRQHLGDGHPALARDLHNQAGVLRLQGEADAALSLYRDALAIKVAAHGEDHTEVALTRNSVALMHIDSGSLDEAESELELARAIYERTTSPERAAVLRNLALVAEQRGDLETARAHISAALAVENGAVPHQRLRDDLARMTGKAARPTRRPAGKGAPSRSPRRPVDAGPGNEPPPTYMADQPWN